MGHEERFPPTRLSAGYGFRKETIAGMRRNGRDAPRAAVRRTAPKRPRSTRSARVEDLAQASEEPGLNHILLS